MEQRTCTSIMAGFDKAVSERQPIPPAKWLEGAMYLNALVSEEDDKLFELERRCAEYEASFLEEGQTAAYASKMLKREELYYEMQKQKAFIKRIEEFIRLAKKQASLVDNRMYATN